MRDDKDKFKPIEERIAELFGQTAYKDRRQGFGGTKAGLTPIDVAHALGAIAHEHGRLVPLAMETKFASTLIHEEALCAGWAKYCKEVEPGWGREDKAFARLACVLAIRELAGHQHSVKAMKRYAWIICVRHQALAAGTWLVLSWLEELCTVGVNSLRPMLKQAA